LDSNTLGVDSSQVSVFKEGDEVSLSSFLKGHDGGGLEAEIGLQGKKNSSIRSPDLLKTTRAHLEILSDFTNETLEGEFANEQLGRLLVPSDFTKSDGTGAETMGLLHTTSCGLSTRVSSSQCLATIEKLTAVLRAADLAASCLRGALPPVDLRAVCLVRAMNDV
jgi:hypothetical protein